MTTIYDLTPSEQDARIGQLAEESTALGDDLTVELCEIALGTGDDRMHKDRSPKARAEARAECLRVIAAMDRVPGRKGVAQ